MLTKLKKHRFIRVGDVLGMATTSLKSNKIRSSLTIMGITIGVFSVVGTMTALSAINSSIEDGLSFIQPNVMRIAKYPSVMINDQWRQYNNRPEINYNEVKRFRNLMEEKGIKTSMNTQKTLRVYSGERKTSPNIRLWGSGEYTLQAYSRNVERGRDLSAQDLLMNRSVVVIGQGVVEKLFYDRDPLGQELSIEGHHYTVIGVVKKMGEAFGQNKDNMACIPATRFMRDITRDWKLSFTVQVIAPSIEDVEHTKQIAIGAFRIVRGLDPEEGNNFEIETNQVVQNAFAKITRIVGSAGLLISVIALITAGVGIMNIMLVSVTERTREIGIRKSLGARGIDVLKQFLLESVFLSELGAALGILLGILVGNLVAATMGVSAVIPVFWAVVAVLVCSGIGIGFGIYPAWKAARLDPVEALRFE